MRARISDEAFRRAREAGYDDAAIVEMVSNAALDIFTHHLNQVAGTDVDFPDGAGDEVRSR